MSERATRVTGACLCGGVRFEARGALRDVIICHCGQCRRTHGHAAAYTSCARDDVVFHQQSSQKGYVSSDRARRGFCSECGASLFWEPLGEGRLAIAAGALAPPDLPIGYAGAGTVRGRSSTGAEVECRQCRLR